MPAFAGISSITSVATLTDGDGGFGDLFRGKFVTTVVIDSNTYALVPAQLDDAVQIINITNPASPIPVADGVIVDDNKLGGSPFTELDGPFAVTTVVSGSNTYALVAASNGGEVQIINITNPASPTPVAAGVIKDGTNGFSSL